MFRLATFLSQMSVEFAWNNRVVTGCFVYVDKRNKAMLVKNQACSRIKEHGELATFNRFYMSSMFISPITTMFINKWSASGSILRRKYYMYRILYNFVHNLYIFLKHFYIGLPLRFELSIMIMKYQTTYSYLECLIDHCTLISCQCATELFMSSYFWSVHYLYHLV